VAIVGAGIGGLAAAIALLRRGANVAVYEKAHELKELCGCAVTRTYVSNGLVRYMAAPERPGRCTVRPNCRHQQAERIVAINDRLQLDTHDAERIANDALAAL
jgi:predicted NAD/FAD-dependent oxidoreductase